MQDEATNTLANVSLGSAIGLIVLYMANMCLGAIPLLGLLALFVYPVLLLVALVGLVTGVMGYRHATRTASEVGKAQSIIGSAICGMWLLFQMLVFGLVMVMGVGVVAIELLS